MKQDKQPNAVARLPRYSHDLSFDRSWTSSTGHIIPVVHDLLNAGETIECSVDLKTRMQPLLRPAMLDIHQKIKYFFVPMSMLYSLWEPIRMQVDDFFSSSLNKSALGRKDGYPIVNFQSYFQNYQFDDEITPANKSSYHCGDTNAPNMNARFQVFDQWHQGCLRLFDALHMSPLVVMQGSSIVSGGSVLYQWDTYCPNVFPYALLAYQAIYFNYFRDEDYEVQDNECYNFDKNFGSSSAITTQASIHKLVGLRYVNRFKDFFMNVHASPLLAGTSLLNDPNSGQYLSDANRWLYDVARTNVRPSQDASNLFNNNNTGLSDVRTTGYTPSNNAQYGSTSPGAVVNASQLRLLFAVDKLLTVTGRARKRVDDQILAHFGFNVPTDIKHNIQYIGEQDGSFGVGDVISTADTGASGSVLGELAGKAYGVVNGQGVKKFTAPCDGVFIGLYYAMPKVRYNAGFDRVNAVANRTDLFIPEFDHLGMQPMFYYQLNQRTSYSGGTGDADKIYGWQWRYEQYKRKFNSVSLAFTNETINPAVVGHNDLSAWTPVIRPDQYSVFHTSDFVSLKVTPHDLDNIMVMPFKSTFSSTDLPNFNKYPYLFFVTDPFIHDMHVKYKKLSIMSTFSVPSLNNQI